MCEPHRVWPLRSECCGRGVPTKAVCAECMKMCCLGGKNSVVNGLSGQKAEIQCSQTINVMRQAAKMTVKISRLGCPRKEVGFAGIRWDCGWDGQGVRY